MSMFLLEKVSTPHAGSVFTPNCPFRRMKPGRSVALGFRGNLSPRQWVEDPLQRPRTHRHPKVSVRYDQWHPAALLVVPAFIKDARAFAATPGAELDQVFAAIAKAEMFLGPAKLRELVRDCLADKERVQGVVSFIQNLRNVNERSEFFERDFALELARQEKDSRTGTEDAGREIANEDEKPLTTEEKSLIRDRLPQVLGAYPSFSRHEKARELAHRLGANLHQFTITCDLRPVFNEDRDKVEAIFPVATLKMVLSEDYLPVTMTAHLSSRQLTLMAKEVTNAQKKALALLAYLDHHKVTIPEVGLQAMGSADQDDLDEAEEST
jgi:hypothetical protein